MKMMQFQPIVKIKKYISDIIGLSSILSSLITTNIHQAQQLRTLQRQMEKLRKNQELNLHRYQKLNEIITNNTSQSDAPKTFSDNHQLDNFYKLFEDAFRGSEETIQQRLTEYLPLFKSLPKNIRQYPIVDLGCGRGELLSLLELNGFKGIGVDPNQTMIQRVAEKGFEAHATDAYSYLSKTRADSLAAVTGFHIVEHIPFEPLMKIFSEAYRAVAINGFVLFETPNPETFSVGAHTFYLDPSHLRPIPPKLLAFMLEFAGFTCEIKRLHPIAELPVTIKSPHLQKLYTAAFGPADYAVIGRKLATTDVLE